MGNDLGFLVIFIILPTALIVSGFWLFLFVRRDEQRRGASLVETESLAVASEASATREDAETIPEPDESTETVDSSDVAVPPPPVFEPDLSDVDPEAAEPSDNEEFWAPVAAEQSDISEEDQQPYRGHTQELTPVPEHLEAPARADDGLAVAPPDPIATEGKDESDVSGDTANLPENWEPDVDDGDDSEESEPDDDEGRRQRQPAARLVPSTENVKRRTGSSGRRVPQIPRSSTRDEDPVEGSDGG